MIGRPIAILIPPDRLDEHRTIRGRIERGERIENYETVRQRKDRTLVDVSLTISPVRNADGTIVLFHRSVEAQLSLADARVVMTGRVGDTQPRQSPFIEFSEARGSVICRRRRGSRRR